MIQNAELHKLVQLLRERFKEDPRYCPEQVPEGFAIRSQHDADDRALLERICAAYIKATERQYAVPEIFRGTAWWRQISETNLGPVIKALAGRDIESLRFMYSNFFRDPCSTGLVGLPVNMQECYFGSHISPLCRDFFLGDALHRLDLWQSYTSNQFPLYTLAAPDIGNPYGISINGVFIRIAAEYQHFYAQDVRYLLGQTKARTVVEIGGGFGGMAYYLVRDHPGITYIDFDVPETVALASYYLLKSFPKLKAMLYGEAPLTAKTLRDADIVLMPSFELPQMLDRYADVCFSSHVLRDMSMQTACAYFDEMIRITRNHILNIDCSETLRLFADRPRQKSEIFKLVRSRYVYWNSARSLHIDELESLFSAR